MELIRALANTLAEGLELSFQILSALTILLGLLLSLRLFRKGARAVQLEFARYLILSLEFLLASDVLATLRAPDWTDISRLAAVAAIRTGLDFYLSRELRETHL
jgi:uncharacterized membrane protein